MILDNRMVTKTAVDRMVRPTVVDHKMKVNHRLTVNHKVTLMIRTVMSVNFDRKNKRGCKASTER